MSQQYPNTRQSTKHSTSGEVDEETTIDARILADIKLAVREEMGEISQLEKIDKALANLVEVQQRMEVVEESIQFTSERLDALATKVLPTLSNRMAQIAEYPSWVAWCDIKGSDGTMLNSIFWKKVQGQKHPGRWEIAEHQMTSTKVLFKTNTKVTSTLVLDYSSESKIYLIAFGLSQHKEKYGWVSCWHVEF